MGGIKNLWHIAIPVNNLQNSVEFYRDALGFKLLGCDEYSDKRQAFIEITDGGINLELFEPIKDREERLRRRPDHLAFEAQNIEELRALLSTRQIDSISEISIFESGMKYMGLKDPNGIPIEFFEGRHLYEEYLISRQSSGK
jgi:glyoxylase I family protein